MILHAVRSIPFALAVIVFSACSEVNDPDDIVTQIEICRECGDGRTIMQVFENGVEFTGGTGRIEDGCCAVWEFGLPLFGDSEIRYNWTYVDNGVPPPVRFGYDSPLFISLSRKTFDMPCPQE